MSPQAWRPERTLTPSRVLSHPAWIVALGVLLLNDHLLKGSGILPGWLTGKLSDFSGMLVAPALLATLARVRTRRGLILAHLVVGAGFTGLELSAALTHVAERAYGGLGLTWRSWSDPSDLLALGFLPLSFILVLRSQASSRAAARSYALPRYRVGLALVGIMACIATNDGSGSMDQTCTRDTYDCDADGWGIPDDCNDYDPSLTPGMGCPPVLAEELCDDGRDDDSDGLIDCLDQDCVFVCADLAATCAAAVFLDPAAVSELSGTTLGGGSLTDGTCVGADAPEVIFQLQPSRSGTVELTVPEGHGVHLRTFCGAAHTETACLTPDAVGTTISATLSSGAPLTVVVEADDALLAGPFTIPLIFRGEGCGDGQRDDGEQCDDGNTLDEDGCSSACDLELDLLCAGTATLALGSTDAAFEGGSSGLSSWCGGSYDATERLFTFVAPTSGTLVLSVAAAEDLVLSVFTDCSLDVESLACSNDAGDGGIESLALAVVEGQTLTIMVEQQWEGDPAGSFTLTATMP